MPEYETDSQSEAPNPSARKWEIMGDLFDEPTEEERPRNTLGERHLSFLPKAASQLEEIGRRGGLTEDLRWHLRQDTLKQLGTANYGTAAIVYENDTDRGLVASHYISLEDDETFGQPIADPEARGLPTITGLTQGDMVPEVAKQEDVAEQPLLEAPESQTLLPAGEEELLLESGTEPQSASTDTGESQTSEKGSTTTETQPDTPVLTREQRWRRKETLSRVRNSTDAIGTQGLTDSYYEFEAAVNGSLFVKPSEFSISSIEDALRTWNGVVSKERAAVDTLRDTLNTYSEFDPKNKVVSLGQTYVQNMEAELSVIEDQARRLENDDMENARRHGEFEESMIHQRMNDMLDRIGHIKGYQSQLRYLIEGEEAYESPVADEEEPEESVLTKLEANHEGLDIDDGTPRVVPEDDSHDDFSHEPIMARHSYGGYAPKKGDSLIERQHRREVIEE
jgi:hypothetical protein